MAHYICGMRLVRVTAVLFLISSSGVSAAAPVNDAAGLGLSTCAVFGKEYGTNPEYAEAMWFSWLQGYLSGLNSALKTIGSQRRNLDGMTSDGKKQYLRRFCNEHPLDYYITGAKRLFLSLPAVDADRGKPTVLEAR
jgi:hypothetical protein